MPRKSAECLISLFTYNIYNNKNGKRWRKIDVQGEKSSEKRRIEENLKKREEKDTLGCLNFITN